jgi:tetratricopeptide (TPR) repeat protein
MTRRPPGGLDRYEHPLSVVRAEHGWTYQDVVDVIARRAGNMAARREKAWRWERWGVVPDMDSQLALAAELGVAAQRLRSEPWPQWLPDGDPVRASFGWSQAGSVAALAEALEYAVVDRRGFMKLAGPALVGLADGWLDADPHEMQAMIRGGRVSADFVQRMEDGLPRLRLLEAAYGGRRARRLIDAELGMVVEVLERSRYTAAVATRLYRLAAELGRMVGWASFDAGLHAAAQRYWVAALHAAHAANDRVLGANILKSMSLQCYDFAQPGDALALARAANAGAATATPRTAAMLALREARAHAALGDASACERLMARAETLFADADPAGDEEPAWLAYFDESEFHAQVGTCYLDLSRPAKADTSLEATLRLAPAAKVRDRATYTVRRASAQNRLGHADRAVALLHEAVPLIQQAPSQRNVRRIFRARDQLTLARHDPRIGDLDDTLTVLVA